MIPQFPVAITSLFQQITASNSIVQLSKRETFLHINVRFFEF